MRKRAVLTSLFLMICYTNCNQAGFQVAGNNSAINLASTAPGPTGPAPVLAGGNVIPVTVGTCYVNAPCVSVTICTPGTSNCQTINNVLLDTGSYGLRLFGSLITVGLTGVTDSSNRNIAECTTYMDGTSQWGSVKRADIVLGTDRAANVPIQVLDANYSGVPSSCTQPETIDTAGYNGILGVGLFTEDCGAACAASASTGNYFACTATTCVGAAVPIANQVSNPVSFMSVDNNGVILQFPAVSSAGAVSTTGTLTLGVGTQANNMVSGLTAYAASSSGNFRTTFNGSVSTGSFIDSGSNGFFFTGPASLPSCSGWYCPTTTQTYSATVASTTGSVASTITFQIGNASDFLSNSNPNYVFNDLGANASTGPDFDWGFPIFLGHRIVVQTEAKVSTLGTGPLWAF